MGGHRMWCRGAWCGSPWECQAPAGRPWTLWTRPNTRNVAPHHHLARGHRYDPARLRKRWRYGGRPMVALRSRRVGVVVAGATLIAAGCTASAAVTRSAAPVGVVAVPTTAA